MLVMHSTLKAENYKKNPFAQHAEDNERYFVIGHETHETKKMCESECQYRVEFRHQVQINQMQINV